jgi:hypothetical protein
MVDVIPQVRSFDVAQGTDAVILNARLCAQNPGLNPQLLAAVLEREYPALKPDFVSYHRRAVLDGDGNPFQ